MPFFLNNFVGINFPILYKHHHKMTVTFFIRNKLFKKLIRDGPGLLIIRKAVDPCMYPLNLSVGRVLGIWKHSHNKKILL